MAAGLAISALSFFLSDMSYTLSHKACNAFFTASVIIGGLGALRFISNQGFFDIIGFSLREVFETHWGSKKAQEESTKETFADYRERRREHNKDALPPCVAGGVFLVLSFIMLAPYYAQS